MSDLAIGVSLTGVEQAVAGLDQVGGAIGRNRVAQSAHSQAVRDAVREGQVYNFNEEQRARATAAAATATAQMAQQQQAAATQAIAFGQRVAGVANAVQALTSQFGGQSHAAGLVGAMANSTVQMAQLGASFGPQGALVGGIIGAAIPAIHEFMTAFTGISERAQVATHSLDEMVSRYTTMQEGAALAQRLADGTASVDERTTQATAAQARYSQELANGVELQNRLNAARAEDSTATERMAAQVIPGLGAAVTVLHAQRQEEIADLQGAIEASHTHAAALRDEADAATTLTHALVPLTEEQTLTAQQDENDRTMGGRLKHGSGGHGGGGQGPDARADAATASVQTMFTAAVQGSSAETDQIQTLQEAMQHLWESARDGSSTYQAEQGRLIQQIQELQSADAQRASAAETHEHDRLEAVAALEEAKRQAREQDDLDAAKLVETTQLRHKTLEHQLAEENATKAKLATEAQARTSMTQQATGQMIGDLTSVFSLIAEGQANAGQGAELMLAGFLQYISQRATVEALAQVAMAIGSYPDPAGMALHAAGAVAWGAVAVAAGVGANAINADVQGQMNTAHPDAATSRDTASASRERENQQSSGPVTFNVYPGGYITKKDMQAGMVDAINQAGRSGYQINASAIRP